MKKSGITLVEMIVAMLLSTIIVSALACQFVAMVRFNATLQNTIDAEREAYTVVNGMTRILRFADPNSIVFFSSVASSGFTATIKTDHLVGFAMSGDHTVRYSKSGTRPMPFPVLISWDGNISTSLSEYFSSWDGSSRIYDSAAQELSIIFTIAKTNKYGQTAIIPINTKIKVRGDL